MKPKQPIHYVGLTGFTSRTQVDAVLRRTPRTRDRSRRIMIGVNASAESMRGPRNSAGSDHPTPETIGSIFSPSRRCFNVIRYTTEIHADRYRDTHRLLRFGRPHLHAIGLDFPWPTMSLLNSLRIHAAKPAEIILYVGHAAIAEAGGVARAIERIKRCAVAGLCHHVVLKPPGKGEPTPAAPYIDADTIADLRHSTRGAVGISIATSPDPPVRELLTLLQADELLSIESVCIPCDGYAEPSTQRAIDFMEVATQLANVTTKARPSPWPWHGKESIWSW